MRQNHKIKQQKNNNFGKNKYIFLKKTIGNKAKHSKVLI